MKIFERVTNNPLLWALGYGLSIALLSTIVSIGASQAMDGVTTLAFIGPVALFFTLSSILFILVPRVFLHNLLLKNVHRLFPRLDDSVFKVLLGLEFLVYVFMVLGYTSIMSASTLGGIGLVFLVALNLVGLAVSGALYLVTVALEHFRIITVKSRVNHLSKVA